MDTSYGVFKYNINTFCSYISYQTDTPLHHVKQKPQITYLHNYINHFKKNRDICFVYENEYIDQHYLEDYSAYYVRCFKTYKRTCSRIHFFQTNMDDNIDYKQEFKNALNNEQSFFNNDNYLGYIVVRPIPHTFLAQVCLRSYVEDECRKILFKNYKVSLFGIDLNIDSIAFQEQDKVLAACATTSLWSFYHAHPNMNISQLPSSSVITKSAYPEQNGYDREFPNSGLSTDMISRSLRAYDFSPEYFEFSMEDTKITQEENFKLFKEYIYAYSSSGLPLILGISIKDFEDKDFEDKEDKGLHAVTILGYSLKNGVSNSEKFRAHKLDKIYVHDDRFGPFLKIDLKDEECKVVIDENDEVTVNAEFSKEIYIPDTLTVGVYHKIRIQYLAIKKTCLSFNNLFSTYLSEEGYEENAELVCSFEWDIKIKQNNDLKQSILNSELDNKEEYLTKSWPKYIWSATALFSDEIMFEMLFDATDIDQGNVFLDILPLNINYSEYIIDLVESYSNKNFNYKMEHDVLLRNSGTFMWGIIEYFRKKQLYTDSLNDLFGYLKIPKLIKPHEIYDDLVVNQCEMKLDRESDKQLNKELSIDHQYIWVIDTEGFLCIGIEGKNKLGHPTLTDGMPARIGGEMRFNRSENFWEINPFSGRYSSFYSEEKRKFFLDNAIQYKFNVYFPDEKFHCKKY